ncbi:unnamed protein product, partial [Laminaria digitata]
ESSPGARPLGGDEKEAVAGGGGDAGEDVPGALVEDVEMTAVVPRSPLPGDGGGDASGDEGANAPRTASRSSSLDNPQGGMAEPAPIAPQMSTRSRSAEPAYVAPQALTRSSAGIGVGSRAAGIRTAPSKLPACEDEGERGVSTPSSSALSREGKGEDGAMSRSRTGSGAGGGELGGKGYGSNG